MRGSIGSTYRTTPEIWQIDFNANPCTKDNDKEKAFLIKADTFQWNLRAYPDTLIYPVSLFIDK